ncbi:putative steryl acetyl hydrolase [Clavispora lusitaniae]|uniref:Steryl acetyl hydrolase n=1 Tax=Clavispora lusitaniae TaxID=36911 RepID=A0ACD0WSQ0_CLALS|nr:putative steryl acetyl hydrolase [Clavispora lusitaniae]QFZ35716.1 putative steryl acetyl hydrolase [Clavispora lusitaniae]QFZ41398.1 putative steryl acetyl hydrolase [Clavispora lusitaniae]QFZ47076.1 putative steryl acetyl hydrolase [Clavispora lusitaniae]QFZ52753.1 putative steryl acetyl hydrolase [Clavispora lusitaniae]
MSYVCRKSSRALIHRGCKMSQCGVQGYIKRQCSFKTTSHDMLVPSCDTIRHYQMFLRSLLVLAKMPLDIFIVVLRFYIFGGIHYRKYSKSLLNCIKLTIFRASLTIDIKHAYLLAPYSNSFLLRCILPFVGKDLVKNVPGYGSRYDKNSIWMAKSATSKADPVIIYSHGGGYFIQTQVTQVRSLMSVYHLLEPKKKSKTSILFLDYTLVGRGKPFPTQLMQLHSTYSNLVSEGHTNIILMGNSAGAHLSISYTQYLKTLQTDKIFPKKLLLISPWVKITPLPTELVEGRSWLQNQHYDMIHYTRFTNSDDIPPIFGEQDPFSLVFGLMAKVPKQESDWKDIPNYSSPDNDVFLIFGEDESFRDDILEFAKYALDLPWYEKVKYGDSHKYLERNHYEYERRNESGKCNLSVFVEPLGVHDSMLFFEDVVASQICGRLRQGKSISVEEIDSKKYFGISRLVRFLNETL